MKLSLNLKRLGIDTHNEAVIYMRRDCEICISEGFSALARIRVTLGEKSIIATLNTIENEILHHNEASLSEYAWKLLGANDGDKIFLAHPKPLHSLSFVRSKIYSNTLTEQQIKAIIVDVVAGRLSEIHISAFVTACASGRLNGDEIAWLTKAMVETGEKLSWDSELVVDKHCVGGLPGNRTTPIIVSIVTSFGLTMPKTSSRSITSPAGTADTMEVLAPVELDMKTIKKIVAQEGGCIAWGGGVELSPADDILIHVERALDIDSEGQMVASILSKKIAAGSNHVVIDMPIGPTAKIRNMEVAMLLKDYLEDTGERLGIKVKVVFTEGFEPVGRGIGPALEARDVLSVLKCEKDAPQDLRDHALVLAGQVLEFSSKVKKGEGKNIATEILDSGKAWEKFQAICKAQGGMREIPESKFTHQHLAKKDGKMLSIDTRRIAILAKLAGAPESKAAGIDLHVSLGQEVAKGETLFTLHSESKGELEYALSYLEESNEIIQIQSAE